MGSFDMTCALSDIGITHGDAVACIFLQQEGDVLCWNPCSPILLGKYYDYGQVPPTDKNIEGFLSHIKSWVVPLPAEGYDHAVDPNHLDWGTLEQLDARARIFLYRREDDKDKPADNTYGIFKDIQIALQILMEGQHFKLTAIGHTGMFSIDFDWGFKNGDPLIEKIQGSLKPYGYAAHVVPARGVAYAAGTPPEDHHVSLLVCPMPGTEIQLNFQPKTIMPHAPMRRILIRMDVLDALFPVDEDMLERAQALRKLRECYVARDSFVSAYGFAYAMKNLGDDGLWFCSERGMADFQHIAPQILAMPADAPLEEYVSWVRLADLCQAARWWMRRGLRPTAPYVGSQDAFEDWGKQLRYHRAMSKILVAAIKDKKAERR